MSVQLALLQDPQGSFDGKDNSQKLERIYFTVVATGNYPALGDPMDFTTLGGQVYSGRPPLFVFMQSANSAGASGYDYVYTPSAVPTQSNGKFQVMQCPGAAGPMVDLGAEAYPAAILNDVIIGYAEFPRL